MANGLEIGSVPSELAQLTWAEQRLIALYRVTIDLVYFYNDDRPGDMERKTFHSLPRLLGKDSAGNWKGRCFCVPQDSFSVNDVLPPDPEELTSTFRVIFLGAKPPEPKDIDLQKALTVDRKKVKAALEWLVVNNELYKRRFERKQLRISQANLDKLPDSAAVPQAVRDDAILRSVDSSKLSVDTSSYTRPDSVDASTDAARTDAHGAHWQHTGLADVNASGVGPDAIERVVDRREHATAPEPPPAVFADIDGGVLQMPSANSVFMLDKGQPDVDHGGFPVLFPFGVGGPNQTGRVHISGQKYIAHLMKYHDRRFATHAPFVFTMFNVLQRQRVCWGARTTFGGGLLHGFLQRTTQALIDGHLGGHQRAARPSGSKFARQSALVPNYSKQTDCQGTRSFVFSNVDHRRRQLASHRSVKAQGTLRSAGHVREARIARFLCYHHAGRPSRAARHTFQWQTRPQTEIV